MKREDYIWIAIRVFGIYLLVLAVVALPSVLSSAYSTWVMWGAFDVEVVTPDSAVLTKLASKLSGAALVKLISATGEVVLFSLAGWYLVRRGTLVFNLINTVDPLSERKARNEATEAAQSPDGSAPAAGSEGDASGDE